MLHRRDAIKEQWADGDFTEQEHFGTALKTAAAIGQCKMLLDLSELNYDQLIGEIDGK